MIEKIAQTLSPKKNLFLFGSLTIACVIGFQIIDLLAKGNIISSIYGAQFAFTVERFAQVAIHLQGENLEYFKIAMYLDTLFPACYALFLAGLLSWIFLKKSQVLSPFEKVIILLPLFAAGFDIMENTFHTTQIYFLDSLSGFIIFFASVFASVKYALILFAIVIFIITFFKKQKSQTT